MILYSPAKINIGLQIIRKRNDGFHDISSLMYPLPFCDIIEIQEQNKVKEKFNFNNSGIIVPDEIQSNLCYKAWKAFSLNNIEIPINFHLHKQIPFGAGLGGGSSNAAKTLIGLNNLTKKALSIQELMDLAGKLGSDCPFFIYNEPMFAEGRGEILSKAKVDLIGTYLVLLNPGIHVNTTTAYANTTPSENRPLLSDLLKHPLEKWRQVIVNDFEESVFLKHPEIKNLKEIIYKCGALYAAMSGSGSSVYGIFRKKPVLPEDIKEFVIWEGKL